MLLQEAEWLQYQLQQFPVDRLSPLLDIGSSTRTFREIDQPYINELVFGPLAARGCTVHHVDLKADDGVDITADLFDDTDYDKLRRLGAKALLSANMLEHVRSPKEALSRYLGLLPQGGIVFLTVPYSFPYHADPIDTMFRPSPEDMKALASPHDVAACEVVHGNTLIGEISLRRKLRRPDTPTFGHQWRPRAQTFLHLLWLFRPYKMTCAVIVKK